jgi:putative NIF3 family GTP cyclohydrolase 1 type 2
LISAGIAVIVTHTAFDVAPSGTADRLAETLELADVSGFGPAWGTDTVKIVSFAPAATVDDITAAMAAAGAGTIGRYTNCSFRIDGTGTYVPGIGADPAVGSKRVFNFEPESRFEMVVPESRVDRVTAALVAAHPYEEPAYDVISARSNAGFVGRKGRLPVVMSLAELAGKVGDELGGVVRVAGAGSVESVAVIPGSGGGMLDSVDADVVVTGDVSHHQARDALARGIAIVDPGHAATERPGVRSLYAAVAQLVGDAVDLTDVDADPWKGR